MQPSETVSSAAETSSRLIVPIGCARRAPRNGPNNPPVLSPAATKPNRRPACSRLKTSAIRLQKTATTNSTNTLTQMK